jgi:hypothetical protein
MRCKKYVITNMLLDNSSTLNVLPRYVLDKILVDVSHMMSITVIVKAYNGR